MDDGFKKDYNFGCDVELSDDMLLFLAKKYLSGKDNLYLSVSGVSDRFALLFGSNRKILAISQCYFISSNHLNNLFHQVIILESLTVFDASHCYWLSADFLINAVTKMTNLVELGINDTKVSLVHLPKLFENCQKLFKLSFNLAEKSLDTFKENVMAKQSRDWLIGGFKRLRYLKIFTLGLSDFHQCTDSWLVVLGVLRWCHDCTDLVIEKAYSESRSTWISSIVADKYARKVFRSVRKEMPPDLEWMWSSLKRLVFIRRGHRSDPYDCFVSHLFLWILTQGNSIEHFWVEDEDLVRLLLEETFDDHPCMKSVLLVEPDFIHGDLDEEEEELGPKIHLLHERFHHLERVGGTYFSRFDHLPNLKYVQGHIHDGEGLGEFCEAHPDLEQLRFDIPFNDHSDYLLGDDDSWKLLNLKVLVYRCICPNKEMMDRLIAACPNIEELHVGKKKLEHGWSVVMINEGYLNFMSSVCFPKLKSLSFNGFPLLDGRYLPSILKQCPRLERLHLGCSRDVTKKKALLTNLGEYLALAANLRDFRLDWEDKDNQSSIELFLKKLKRCTHFERLCLRGHSGQLKLNSLSELEESLIKFSTKMSHLVAFCLFGFENLETSDAKDISRRVTEKMQSSRPAFWLHLGAGRKIENNDPSVPRIHMDGIVDPADWFYVPPPF